MGCAKTVLIGINVIFFLAGAAILAGGLFVRLTPDISRYAEAVGLSVVTNQLYIASYVLIAFGAFTFVVGFCGCYGAIKESKVCLGIYITFIIVIVAAELGGGAFVYIGKDAFIDELTKVAKEYIRDNYTESNTTSDKGWDFAMEKLKCCGVNGVADFANSNFTIKRNMTVPRACCKDDNFDQCQREARSASGGSDHLYRKGCADAMSDFLKDKSTILIAIGCSVAGFELLVIVMAFCACCSFKDD